MRILFAIALLPLGLIAQNNAEQRAQWNQPVKPFRILGRQWRVVHSMSYQGLCTFIFFCSGPSARVLHPAGGAAVAQFDLGEGSGQTQVFRSGPGLYEVAVNPGGDTANWSISVEDYY